MVKSAVIKVTGSVFDNALSGDTKPLSSIAAVIRSFAAAKPGPFAVIAGGGNISRLYINTIRSLGGSEDFQDEVGLLATRLNAALMIAALRDAAFPKVLTSVESFRIFSGLGKVLVGGGFHPGFSTAACAALVAEALSADLLVIMSKSGGVYDKDPELYPDAKLLREISVEVLSELVSKGGAQCAGFYPLLDVTSIAIIRRSKLRTLVIPAKGDALEKALQGALPLGTVIRV